MILCFDFVLAADLAAALVVAAAAVAAVICHPAQLLRDEDADFLCIIADLEALLVENDRALQDARILLDELNELIRLHGVNINVPFLNDLGALRDDIIRSILAPHEQMLDLAVIQQCLENILFNIREIPILEPLLDFTAACASWRGI